jgi:hypothetical protein
MSDLVLLFERLAQQALAPLLIALVASAAIVSLIRNWRVSLPALIIQSVVVGVLLARVIQPSVALVKPLAGIIACVTLSIAAQRADNTRAAHGEQTAGDRIEHVNWRSVPAQVLLRAIAVLIVLVAAFGATVRFPLPGNARELALGAYILLACGLFVVATSPEGLNIGTGLLMMISGVEIGYIPLEPSISVSILLGLMTLVVTIAIAYLTLADGDALTETLQLAPVLALVGDDDEEEDRLA